MAYEIELRACCGRLRFALEDAIDALPAGAQLSGLRWGETLIPLDVEAGRATPEMAGAILDQAQRWLGTSTSCYAGRGALVVG